MPACACVFGSSCLTLAGASFARGLDNARCLARGAWRLPGHAAGPAFPGLIAARTLTSKRPRRRMAGRSRGQSRVADRVDPPCQALRPDRRWCAEAGERSLRHWGSDDYRPTLDAWSKRRLDDSDREPFPDCAAVAPVAEAQASANTCNDERFGASNAALLRAQPRRRRGCASPSPSIRSSAAA